MLVVEDLRVHHPGMTVDRVMQIPVAPAGVRTFPSGRVTGPAGRPVLVRAPAEHLYHDSTTVAGLYPNFLIT